jgi:hypothetical protein
MSDLRRTDSISSADDKRYDEHMAALEKRMKDPNPTPIGRSKSAGPQNRITPTSNSNLDLAGESQDLKAHPIWH